MEEKDIRKELERLKQEIEDIKRSGKPVEIPAYYLYYPPFPYYGFPCSPCYHDCQNCPYRNNTWQPIITFTGTFNNIAGSPMQ